MAAIRDAAFAFAGSASPSDDLTCVAMAVAELEVPLARREPEIRTDLQELVRARAFVRSACRDVRRHRPRRRRHRPA